MTRFATTRHTCRPELENETSPWSWAASGDQWSRVSHIGGVDAQRGRTLPPIEPTSGRFVMYA